MEIEYYEETTPHTEKIAEKLTNAGVTVSKVTISGFRASKRCIAIAGLFGVSADRFVEAVELAASRHRASSEHFMLGLERVAPIATIAGWSLEETLSELGKLYDIGYGEPEIESAPLSERDKAKLQEMGVPGSEMQPGAPRSAGAELHMRIRKDMRWNENR